MSARGPLAGVAPRTRTHRSIPAPPTPAELHASQQQSLTRLQLELLNGLPQQHPCPRAHVENHRRLPVAWSSPTIYAGNLPIRHRSLEGRTFRPLYLPSRLFTARSQCIQAGFRATSPSFQAELTSEPRPELRGGSKRFAL